MRAGFATPQEALVHLTWEGAAARYPDGIPDNVRADPRPRARADRRAAIRALFPHRPRHRPLRALQNILCQGRGSAANSTVCYCLGITEVDPACRRSSVRALHLRRPQRAARHRRRFRARAARGGDPVHLPALRPRAHRHRRDRDLLPRPLRDPRGRQGLRPVGRHDRRALLLDLGHGRRRGPHRRARARRHRRRQPAHEEDARARRARFSPSRAISPSMSAASSSPAAGSTRSCRSRMPRWTSAPSSNGTRTISTRSASSRSMCSGSAC